MDSSKGGLKWQKRSFLIVGSARVATLKLLALGAARHLLSKARKVRV